MRKVFLDNLPKNKKGQIKWKDTVGYQVRFIYDDVSGCLDITGYKAETQNPKIEVKYNDYKKWIDTYHFKQCGGFSNIIGYKKSKINEDYFKQIDSPNKAYILGFMYADGTVYENTAKLDLQIDDLHILEEIRQEMQIETPVKIYRNQKTWFYDENGEKRYYPKKDTARLYMNSKKVAGDLAKLGCVPSKTYTLDFPNEDVLPKAYIRDFIRGYFDGDGSLSCSTRKNIIASDRLHFNMTFTGTYEICAGIKDALNESCCSFVGDIRSRHKRNVNNYTLTICGNNVLLSICEYLYNDASIKLKRKYEKYEQLIEEIDRRSSDPYSRYQKKFKMFKNKICVGVFNSISELIENSEEQFGVKLCREPISLCLHKKYYKSNIYKGFTFEYTQ